MKTYHHILTIAGSDSCGGAGIEADIKTISALGCYASVAITAVTAQNTLGVRSICKVMETVSACLDEAAQRADWRPVAIYDGTAVVGFAMYGYFWEYPPAGRVWLDRLLIDAARQGRGYGRAAVASLLARLAEEYGPRDIYLSVVDGNTAAARLYEAFGFVFTEERDVHGEHVMRRPAAPVRGS